jgi:hypothetical protein
VVSVIGGCASTDAPLDGPVDYELSAFEATLNTALHIETDGTVTRTVTHIVSPTEKPSTTETATLDRATLDDLARKIDDAQFSTLEPMYGCGGCVDHSVHTITVRIDGAPYMVQADKDYPDRLQPVIDALRDISERSFD